jgi:hypothetical protein
MYHHYQLPSSIFVGQFGSVGAGIITLDPTFGSFTLLEPVFTLDEPDSLVKVFRLFRLEWIFFVFKVWTQYVDVQHLIYWQGERVCDGLLFLVYIVSLSLRFCVGKHI